MKIIYTSTKHKPKRKSRKVVGEVYQKAEKRPFTPLKVKPSRELRPIEKAPSLYSSDPIRPKEYPKYEGEFAERERLAQIEIEKKKKKVGILVNKSGYQYLGDAPPDIIKGLGRK